LPYVEHLGIGRERWIVTESGGERGRHMRRSKKKEKQIIRQRHKGEARYKEK
jgi:hypothetical protein